jgi:hypothetical protein
VSISTIQDVRLYIQERGPSEVAAQIGALISRVIGVDAYY